jgi:hypothetical protein
MPSTRVIVVAVERHSEDGFPGDCLDDRRGRHDPATRVDDQIPLRPAHEPNVTDRIGIDINLAEPNDSIALRLDRVPEFGNRLSHLFCQPRIPVYASRAIHG